MAAVISATFFILPFKVASRDGNGSGAALGLLFFVGLIFAPWGFVRLGRMGREQKRATVSLAWKLALFAGLGNVAQGWAFETLHAGVAVVFIQMNVLFVAVLGVVWLGESLRWSTGVGILLAALGMGVAQWPALSGHLSVGWGVLWSVVAAFLFSLMDVFSRRDAHGVDAVLTNVVRAWMAALFLTFFPGALQQFVDMSPYEVGACAVAAIFGPGIARQLLISAARDLPAAESALLQQIRPLLAIPLTSLVFGAWPTVWEWWGAVLVATGVVLPLGYALLRRAHDGAP